MIVRIMGEGQLELEERHLGELNELDAALGDAVAANDQPAFDRDLARLLSRVHAVGAPVLDDRLAVSGYILPGPGSSLADVRALLGDEGLIPG